MKIFILLLTRKKLKLEGFTLIELMVVVIILGVLSSVAIPSLVGQIRQAKETEYKMIIGTVTRAQQSYYFEKQRFAQGTDDQQTLTELGLSLSSRYVDDNGYNIIANVDNASIAFKNSDYQIDKTRAYSAATFVESGNFSTIICLSEETAEQIDPPLAKDDCGVNLILRQGI